MTLPPTRALLIADVPVASGRIGIAVAPGRNDMPGRELAADLDAVAAWGAAAVVTLVEEDELRLLGIADLGDEVRARGMDWLHRPIADYGVPDATFEADWIETGRRLRGLLESGSDIFIHCRGGLGRSGSVAVRLLVECGIDPDAALATVRAARPGAVETPDQERWAKFGKATNF